MKKVISILLMLLLCFPAYSQDASLTDSGTEQKSTQIEIYFDLNSYVVDSDFKSNRESLSNLVNLITQLQQDPLTTISKIEISSYASPDGDVVSNDRLSQKRANSVLEYVKNQTSIANSLISIEIIGVAWDMLRERVVESETPYKEEVVGVIDNVPVETWRRVALTDRWQTLVDSRNKHLMALRIGIPYNYMQRHIFPYLHKSSIEIIYVHKEPEVEVIPDPIFNTEPEPVPEIETAIIIEPSNEIVEITESKKERLPRNPIFAVKTNLAGLGMGVANIGVEVPFMDHFSVDGSFYYSPYTIDSEWRIRLAMLQSEFRYWLSTPLDKHFVGLHAHAGLFNVSTNQWSRYQNSTNQPLWGFGLSYGYSLYLNRALSLEFNIGAGYASLRYDTFYNVENGALYNHTERGYWGVTRAGVSLNYIINRK